MMTISSHITHHADPKQMDEGSVSAIRHYVLSIRSTELGLTRAPSSFFAQKWTARTAAYFSDKS